MDKTKVDKMSGKHSIVAADLDHLWASELMTSRRANRPAVRAHASHSEGRRGRPRGREPIKKTTHRMRPNIAQLESEAAFGEGPCCLRSTNGSCNELEAPPAEPIDHLPSALDLDTQLCPPSFLLKLQLSDPNNPRDSHASITHSPSLLPILLHQPRTLLNHETFSPNHIASHRPPHTPQPQPQSQPHPEPSLHFLAAQRTKEEKGNVRHHDPPLANLRTLLALARAAVRRGAQSAQLRPLPPGRRQPGHALDLVCSVGGSAQLPALRLGWRVRHAAGAHAARRTGHRVEVEAGRLRLGSARRAVRREDGKQEMVCWSSCGMGKVDPVVGRRNSRRRILERLF